MNMQCVGLLLVVFFWTIVYVIVLYDFQTVMKKDDSTANKLCFIEQWHDTLCSPAPEKVLIQPHDRDIVYRLVDTALEILLGQAKSSMIYNPEAPGYIIDEESVRVYGRVRVCVQLLDDCKPGWIHRSRC